MKILFFFLACLLQIEQLKAHISELNLHAEAQAKEYKQKVSYYSIVFNKMLLDVIVVVPSMQYQV